ncbi:MAG: response regulator [Bacteroidetes bacterium]|nr:response regulator [Bacteroidota bacterium]
MKTVLLIEDNRDVRENTAEILELSDYKVLTAENGKKGIDLARKHKPDVVICDIMMPELDGYGVLQIMSRSPETSGIPFIFLTAKAEKSDIRKGMNLGADDYITKPFSDTELLTAVETRLKKSEFLRKEYEKNMHGLYKFIDDVRGIEELGKLSDGKMTRKYRKKDIIYHEGDYPHGVLFVHKGKVKTYKTNEDGKELIIDMFSPGHFVGYMAILENSQYSESAAALEETEICIVPRDDFLALLYNNRDVSSKFIKMLSDNIIEKEERLLQMAYSSLRRRVAEVLLTLQKKYQPDKGDNFVLDISRENLAALVGTATESLIRTLSEFKDEKLIEIKGREVKIINPQGLEKVIKFS